MKTRPTPKRSTAKRTNASAAEETSAATKARAAKSASTPKAAPTSGRPGGRPKGLRRTIRPHSLHPALEDAENRRQVYRWYFADGLSENACIQEIQKVFGIKTNKKALKHFIGLYGFVQKVEEAKAKAEEEKGRLPADWEAKVREALAQRKFVTVFDQLTQQQLLAYEKVELEKKKIDLKAAEIYLTDRRQALAERKASTGEAPSAIPALSAEEEALRIRNILGQE